MARAAAVQVRGLREFQAELSKLPGKLPNELRKANAEIARWLRPKVRGAASGMGGPQAHFAGAIGSSGTRTSAKLTVRPDANAAFAGAKKHTGWYAAARYAASPPQHPPWIGADWEAGGPGGPYAINPTVRDNVDEIVDTYGDAIDRLARRAFPD